MKTPKIARSTGRTLFKKLSKERNFLANLEEYESDVLDQTLSQSMYSEIQ